MTVIVLMLLPNETFKDLTIVLPDDLQVSELGLLQLGLGFTCSSELVKPLFNISNQNYCYF
jgi:hypothetical protein